MKSSMENTAIQQIHTTPTKNKDLRIYKEERNQELSNPITTLFEIWVIG